MTPRKQQPRAVPDAPPHAFLGPESLSNEQFRKAVGAIDHQVDARYAWDTGVAISRFLRGLQDGELWGRYCRECRRTLVPPRMFCEEDFRPTDRWVQVADTGTVNTFSICYIRWDMVQLDEPELPFVLTLDGIDNMAGIMHKLGDVAPGDVHIGMEVEAVWKPAEERTGSILDIEYFRPRDAKLRKAKAGAKRKPAGRRKKPAGRKKPSAKRKAG